MIRGLLLILNMRKLNEISSSKDIPIPLYSKSSKNLSGRRRECLYTSIFYGAFVVVSLGMNFILLNNLLINFNKELHDIRYFQKVHQETYKTPEDPKINALKNDLQSRKHDANENFVRLHKENDYKMSKDDQKMIHLDVHAGDNMLNAELGNRKIYIEKTTQPSNDYDDDDDDDYGQREEQEQEINGIDSQMVGNLVKNMQNVHHIINAENDISYRVIEGNAVNQKRNYQKMKSMNSVNHILRNENVKVQNKYQLDQFNSPPSLLNDVDQKSIKNGFNVHYNVDGKINQDQNENDNRKGIFGDKQFQIEDNSSKEYAKVLRASFINKNQIRFLPVADEN